jgi:phosphopentomutase
MINRIILLVVDGLGVGAAADASEYGDERANTLVHMADSVGGLSLPSLESLGLGHVSEVRGIRTMAQPIGSFGRVGFKSKGLDSLVGFWEIAGCVSDGDGATFPDGYSPEIVTAIEEIFGRKVLGSRLSSAEQALSDWSMDHLSSGAPIVWTDGRQTCHLAAHESVWRPEELYQHARGARKTLKEAWGIRRVVAHPLVGASGALQFGSGRRDFAGEPSGLTMLDVLNRAGQILIGVGKVSDLFGGRGLTRSVPVDTWVEALDEASRMFKKVPRGLIVVGLDVIGSVVERSAAALQDFDRRLPDFLAQLRPGDLLIMTGDHGRDSMKPHAAPTREYVPLLVTGPRLAQGVNLEVRASAADVGQTIVEALQGESLASGESFLDALKPG